MNKTNLKRVHELFSEFKLNRAELQSNTGKLSFESVDGLDVYNISQPFISGNKTIIAGRVEPRNQEHSTVIFFEEMNNRWYPIADAPTFKLQDPFITFINNELVFGGVEITVLNEHEMEGNLEWKTVFYRGSDIFNLVEFFSGPEGMKDIRLCDLENGKIAVFTRPRGTIGGRGTIGYTEVNTLNELSINIINSAILLEDMFHPMDWGGVNNAQLLENGEIGLLAHVAYFDHDDYQLERHYYAASFIFDPILKQFKDLKIIASRDQFEDGPAKREDLTDVIFPSGMTHDNGVITLFAGVSDAEAHWIEINDPFRV